MPRCAYCLYRWISVSTVELRYSEHSYSEIMDNTISFLQIVNAYTCISYMHILYIVVRKVCLIRVPIHPPPCM